MIIQKIDKNKKISPRYKTILEILKNIPDKSSGIEVGVLHADLSIFLLENCLKIKKLYLIDPWKKYNKEEYVDSVNEKSQKEYDEIYLSVKQRIKSHEERVELLRGESKEFENKFSENSLDFIYLDANHMYENVFNDISTWYPKIKKGGILFGNDFMEDGYKIWQKDVYGKPICYGEYGVRSAVRVYCKQNQINYRSPGENQWYIIKR
jgi:hypothetical protein